MPRTPKKTTPKKRDMRFLFVIGGLVVVCAIVYALSFSDLFSVTYSPNALTSKVAKEVKVVTAPAIPTIPPLNKADYDARMLRLANVPATTTATTATTTKPLKKALWPAPTTVYPNAGALLPFHRIVAYYGNFYSKGMGVLGQYPEDEVIQKLQGVVAQWNAADPTTPVIPAIHYIVTTAQGSPGKEGLYILRMPDDQVDHALEMAQKVNGVVFLDFQVGLSTIQHELPMLDKYLAMPNVHVGIDPEFSMKDGVKPGREIGTMDASDVNYVAQHLAKIVRDNNLPPKILVIHRFTEDMLTNYQNIQPLPEVQIVIDMDGWGFAAKKINTYQQVVYKEPVQFTGFKLFYKNDLLPPSTHMLTPQEILKLTPQPVYIQYQ